MSLLANREEALGKTLSAPIHCRDREIASMKIANNLEIFFDELRSAGQQYDCRPGRRQRKHGPAETAAIRAAKIDRLASGGNRIGRYLNKFGYREPSRTSRAITLMSPAIDRRPDR